MGKAATRRNARERKRAKQRSQQARQRKQAGRDEHHHAGRPGSAGHELPIEKVIDAAVSTSFDPRGRPRRPRPELLQLLATRQAEAAPALAAALIGAISTAWHRHWQPTDLVRATARNCGPAPARLVSRGVVRELCRYEPGPLPPRWQAQVDQLDTGPAAGDDPEKIDTTWVLTAADEAERLIDDLTAAVQALTFVRTVPDLPKIGPIPGEPVSAETSASPTSAVDPGVLPRVTSLLAKAESTTFPEEAEALTAKAQQLMVRHAIDAVMVEANRKERRTAPVASARRIGIDDPYGQAKAILLQAIAEANRSQSVWSKAFGFATVFGDEADLDAVELLFTSLLVQSARAMIAASPPGAASAGRTRSFRQSFLVAFASRIGDRLQEVVAEAVQESGHSGDLLPVLASREQAAEQACQEAFPTVRRTSTTASSTEGWHAGREAADRAQLDINDSIGSGHDQDLGKGLPAGPS
jgi:hypothetical protein